MIVLLLTVKGCAMAVMAQGHERAVRTVGSVAGKNPYETACDISADPCVGCVVHILQDITRLTIQHLANSF